MVHSSLSGWGGLGGTWRNAAWQAYGDTDRDVPQTADADVLKLYIETGFISVTGQLSCGSKLFIEQIVSNADSDQCLEFSRGLDKRQMFDNEADGRQ